MTRFFLGITGASGHVYARALLRALLAAGHRVDLALTSAGAQVLDHELGITADDDGRLSAQALEELAGAPAAAVASWAASEVGAPAASGTTRLGAVMLVPCSMGTLARVAAGFSSNLVERAADVALKEGRPLLIVPRETPLSEIHLENMLRLKRLGATIMPAMPGWYQHPGGLDELVSGLVGKMLDSLGLEHGLCLPWSSISEPAPEAGTESPTLTPRKEAPREEALRGEAPRGEAPSESAR